MSAMVTNYSTEAGKVTPRLVAYHQERAKGGVAMIEPEAAYVHPGGKGYVHQLGLRKGSASRSSPLAGSIPPPSCAT